MNAVTTLLETYSHAFLINNDNEIIKEHRVFYSVQ